MAAKSNKINQAKAMLKEQQRHEIVNFYSQNSKNFNNLDWVSKKR
jgi:hypothetical protein